MFRGTTPIIELEADFNTNLLDVLYITFKQNDKVIFEKKLSDCMVKENLIICKLTQEDTLKLKPTLNPNGSKDWLYIQVRYRLIEGTSGASYMDKIEVEQILKDGAI